MLKVATAILMATLATSALADTYVQGHYRKDGTYVQPYHRSDANNTTSDNYSTQGNINPYTGQPGTKQPSNNNPYYNP